MSEMSTTDTEARFKKEAAESAVELVESGMKVGLGTGSTAIFATRRIGAMLKAGELRDIVAFATSRATADEAVRLGIPMPPDDLPEDLDLTIDGADEVDPELNLIKGGGGALLREKVVAQVSARKVIVVDETKSSPRLGERRALPVEVIPFGWRSQERYLESLGATITVRQGPDGAQFVTDFGQHDPRLPLRPDRGSWRAGRGTRNPGGDRRARPVHRPCHGSDHGRPARHSAQDAAAVSETTGTSAEAVQIRPSILAADRLSLREQVSAAERAGAARFQVDVMGGSSCRTSASESSSSRRCAAPRRACVPISAVNLLVRNRPLDAPSRTSADTGATLERALVGSE